MPTALIFPGQGSQHVGMARALAEQNEDAAAVLAEADEVLGFSLTSLMFDGPEEELRATKNAQPALLTHSTAALRALGDRVQDVSFAAGHSLGEFSAHVAAGTLTFADALRAVRLRGELMYQTGQERPGTMLAILGIDDEAAFALCDEATSGLCVPANFNSPGQVVISGDLEAVAEVAELAREAGAKRVVQLSVSGAFHSPLMEPAADGLRAHLADLDFSDPAFPVVANVSAEPVTSGEGARELLVTQLTSAVRWSASVGAMVSGGASAFVELGPGNVLCGLNRRNAKGLSCVSIGEPDQVEAFGGAA